MSSPFTNPNYKEATKPSQYFRITEGTHLIRILTPASECVSYYAEFVEDKEGKKQKYTYPDNGDGVLPPNRKSADCKVNFALKIWNYETEQIQVWEVSQRKLKDFLLAIPAGKIKKDFTKFDIQIQRKGKTKNDTEYFPDKGEIEPLKPEIEKAMANTFVNLQAMATGQDPFDSELVIEPSSKSETVDDTPLPEIILDDVTFDENGAPMPF